MLAKGSFCLFSVTGAKERTKESERERGDGYECVARLADTRGRMNLGSACQIGLLGDALQRGGGLLSARFCP